MILRAQEEAEDDTARKEPDNSDFPGALKIATDLPAPDHSAAAPVSQMHDAQATPSTLRTNISTSVYSDRSLPPTPMSLTTTRPGSPLAACSALHDSPRGRSLLSGNTSRTVSPSHLSPSARSRSKSPSIANLDHLSVVKQRLAQIEHDPSRSPSSAIPSPTLSRKSTRTRELSPLSPASARTSFGRAGDLQRLHSLRHDAASTASFSSKPSPIMNIDSSRKVQLQSKMESAYATKLFETPPSRLYSSAIDSQLDQSNEGNRDYGVLSKEPVPAGMANDTEFKDIQEKLYDIQRQMNSRTGDPPVGIVQTLAEMQAQLKYDLPEMIARLQEIKFSHKDGDLIKDSLPGNVINNIGRSSDVGTQPFDLSDVHVKLDNLLSIRQPDEDKHNQIVVSPSTQAERELRSAQALALSAQVRTDVAFLRDVYLHIFQKVNELLGRARSGEAQQSVQIEQQADNTRYLNELNTVSYMHAMNFLKPLEIVRSGWKHLSTAAHLTFKWLH